MCFEFEIPNKKKDKKIDEKLEVEPQLTEEQEPADSVSKVKSTLFFFKIYLG